MKIQADPKAWKRLKDRIRCLTGRNWRVSMSCRIDTLNQFTSGWLAYFRIADLGNRLRDLDGWLYRRMRQIRWKEWKRYTAKRRNLHQLGIPERPARE